MAFEHSITKRIIVGSTGQAGRSISKTYAKSGGASLSIEEAVPAPSTNLVIACPIDVSEVKSILICCDRDCTINTNDDSGGSPDDTFALVGGEPYMWDDTSLDSLILTADVVDFRVTLASGEDATLQVEVLSDPTP